MNKMKFIWIFSILSIAALIVLLVTQQNVTDDEIKIGVITSLTGTIAPYGVSSLEGIKLATEEINMSGGIDGKKIKLIIEDDKSNPKDAVLAFQKLTEVNKVQVILGPIGSTSAMSCAPIANKNKVILFSPAAATPLFTNSGDYTFRNRASANLEVEKMADIAFSNLDIKQASIIYINNDVGLSFYPVFLRRFESLGGKILDVESFNQGAKDMRTQLLKIKQKKTEAIYLIGHVEESGYVLKQARELGIKCQFLGHLALEGPDLFKIAGDAANGVIYTATGYDSHSKEIKVKEFERKYKAKFNKEGDVFAATAYDAVYILKLAIEQVGYSAENIKNELHKIKDFPGITGLTTFDKNGDVEKPILVKMIKDKKFIIVENLAKLKRND